MPKTETVRHLIYMCDIKSVQYLQTNGVIPR